MGISGSVDVAVFIDEEGKVYYARICKGHPILRKAALAAAFKTEFEPLKYMGKPSKSLILLTVDFK